MKRDRRESSKGETDSAAGDRAIADSGRRRSIGLAVGGVAAMVAGCAGQATGEAPAVRTRKRVRWKLVSSFPRSLDTLYGASELVAERVEAMSGGDFSIRPYPAGEIVGPLEVLDVVQNGSVQLAHSASYYFIGKDEALAFDAGLPFGLSARQQFAWLYEGGGTELLADRFAAFNILAFPGGSTGVQMGGWFRREIQSLDTLRGMIMRIPGLGGKVMERLGVTTQVLGGGDIYPALEQGTIDATEWVGPYDDEKLGFHRVAKYYYYPGWWEPGPTLSFLVNRAAWDGLSTDLQEIFRSAAAEVSIRVTARYDTLNAPALERLLAEGVQLRAFPDDVMEAAERESFALFEETASSDAGYRAILQSWKQARQSAYRWFGTAEDAYARFAYRRRR